MRILVLSFAVNFFVLHLFAQNYTLADNDAGIKFSIKNFGLNVSGSFKGLKGKCLFDPAKLSVSVVIANVDASTVNTGIDSRNSHLKKEEYFDVANYPLISFVSTKITNSTKAGTLIMEGKITIKGVTKAVTFPFTATSRNDNYLFVGEFKLNRRDFKVGGRSLVLSDNLTVILSVFAKKSN